MIQAKALVSILLPVHNGFPYLPKTVESIIAQSETRWILYALNDGSTDESAGYLNGLNDPRIVVVHQEHQGLSQTLNNGLKRCRTEFIARMDADDICHANRLEKQIEFLKGHPEVGLLGSQIRRMGTVRTDSGSNLPTSHDRIMEALMDGQHAICHPSIMCRKKAFDQIGEYQPCIGEDWDLYLRMGEHWKLANHPEALLSYRYHAGSINGARMAELRKRIRYHCDCAERRSENLAEISYEEFSLIETQQGTIRKLLRRSEDLSRARYHGAIADILGGNPVRGWARLGTAAATSPHLTLMRLVRTMKKSSNDEQRNGNSVPFSEKTDRAPSV